MLRIFALLWAFLFAPMVATAATFTIDINFASGPAAGTQGTGTLELTGYTGAGFELFSLNGALLGSTGSVDNLSATAFGQSFDLSNGLSAPQDPIVIFQNGVLQSLLWTAANPVASLFLDTNSTPPIEVDLRTGSNVQSLGTLTVTLAQVPLPANALLLASGIVALAFGRRRSAGVS